MSVSPFTVPMRPARDVSIRYVRLFPAIIAGAAAALAFLVVYYLTLGLLPSVFAYPVTLFPVAAWAHRLDLAQFFGSLVDPPYPTAFTWVLGLILLFGYLVSLGVVYAVLMAWVQQRSETKKGIGFGIGAGINLLGLMWVADGFHPAIMRNVLPDTGAFMFGWCFLAPFQVLLAHAVYGAVLGRLYAKR